MLPNFLGVGAGRAGTTWVHTCLEEHPDVCVPRVKEIDFFSLHYHKGLRWYESFFRHHRGETAVGEISPTYMVTREVPERIRAWNPRVRLLFFLREPVERAYSHYCLALRAGTTSPTLDEALVPGTRLLDEGLYFSHLSFFLRYFPREQIKVLLFDDLKESPERFVRELFSFLGVDPTHRPTILHTPVHPLQPLPRLRRLFDRLTRLRVRVSERSLLAHEAIDFLRRRGTFDFFHRLNRGSPYPPLPDAKKRWLAEYYRPDVEALSGWLGRDLTHWLRPYREGHSPPQVGARVEG